MVRNTREWLPYSPSTGSVHCSVCRLFALKTFSNLVIKEGFIDWRNTIAIDNHEKKYFSSRLYTNLINSQTRCEVEATVGETNSGSVVTGNMS